jgi:hypothetical protein
MEGHDIGSKSRAFGPASVFLKYGLWPISGIDIESASNFYLQNKKHIDF